MDPLINDFKTFSQKVTEQLKEDLKSLRTGRASPSLVEGLIVEAYGGQSKLRLMELSSITTEGPSLLIISPYDPSTIPDIEKAILKSPLGISPQTQGTKILIKIPQLSTEQRDKLIKILSSKIEEKKVMIRNQRDEMRKKIKQQLEDKAITEDDKFRLEKEIDTQTQNAMSNLQTIKETKEEELRQI